jgi:hypothetical protein
LPFIDEHLHVRNVVIPVSDYAQLAIENVIPSWFPLSNQRLGHGFRRPRSTNLIGERKTIGSNLLTFVRHEVDIALAFENRMVTKVLMCAIAFV